MYMLLLRCVSAFVFASSRAACPGRLAAVLLSLVLALSARGLRRLYLGERFLGVGAEIHVVHILVGDAL